ncbi:C-C chemokine receptor type 4 [Bombina bombina]|uniref:C-C chemokine receptor type 4 n=1 Tax=Bombina bombina TaxID=8345 RepID=UPI00235A81A5|nr:C-C chemokine receptor type 4 [Bombina bombina]
MSMEENVSTEWLYTLTDYDDYQNLPTPCSKESIEEFGKYFLPSLYCLVFMFGLVGNILVVLVLAQYKKLKSTTDVYILNLAISDLIFVFSLPFWAYYAKEQWVFGNSLCKVISAIYRIGFYSGIFFITLMSMDRYLAIVHAIFANSIRTVSFGVITSIVAWAAALIVSIPDLIFYREYHEQNTNHTSCKLSYPEPVKTWTLVYSLQINILGMVVPVMVMTFCYLMIIKTLLRCKNEKKIKAVKLIFVVMVVFLLFWVPYNVVLFIKSVLPEAIITSCAASKNLDYLFQVTETISFIHCCLNPIIYVFLGEKFKTYLQLFLQKCCMHLHLYKVCRFSHKTAFESVHTSFTPSTSEQEISNAM